MYYGGRSVPVKALVDSGSSMNILPYDLGLALGLVWEEQNFPVDVGGVLPDTEAYGVLVRGKIEGFEAFVLACGWVSKPSRKIRTILGQSNFFQLFRVNFDARAEVFDLIPYDLKSQ
ncbi:MAG: hypothetical protein GY801_50785 [bacterium]|nr:hypothetical protein [bacterium]